MNENKASDLAARLLATENLTVVRSRAPTASFDIKSRVLTIPNWKDMTPEIEDMMVAHEVGHALYTGVDYIDPIKQNPKMKSYMNVLEDVRIEKLIKRKYPGLRKRMNEGYRQLNERDFFGVSKVQDFSTMLLIDKINLYFKVGYACGVEFTPEEKLFVAETERTETIDDVIDLASRIWEYSKAKRESQRDVETMEIDIPEDEYDSFEIDYDDSDFTQEELNELEELDKQFQQNPSVHSNPKQDQESHESEELESKTDRVFSDKMEELADCETEYVYWDVEREYVYDPIVSYKTILSDTKDPEQLLPPEDQYRSTYQNRYLTYQQQIESLTRHKEEVSKFKSESMRAVNYLVKEFEMKKSATMYKRATQSKIGSLDMRKIYAYKLKEDLFKRVTSMPKGKNHGMVFLLDWSGSMEPVIEDTLRQVINLAMFCNRAQIPFQVLAFTNYYVPNDKEEHNSLLHKAYAQHKATRDAGKKIVNANTGFHLLELFSSRMTTSEFNTMIRRVLHQSFMSNTGYSLGGTPLNEALIWVYNNLETFIKKNNVEKTTFITLTDGDGSSMFGYSSDMKDWYYDDNRKKIKMKHFIREHVSKKSFSITTESASQTEAILRMIKARYGVNTVGFYICENKQRYLENAIYSNICGFAGDKISLIASWRNSFKEMGFASIKNAGRDELFILPQSSTKIQETDLTADSEMNVRAIAKNFSKFLNTKRTSRILLDRFVDLVA